MASCYTRTWLSGQRDTISSYLEVSRAIHASRDYWQGILKSGPVDDYPSHGISIEIPLLWGSF